MTPLYKWLAVLFLVCISLGSFYAYSYHSGVVAQKNKEAITQAEAKDKAIKEKQAIQDKYDSLSTQYETLKLKRIAVAQKNKQTEERIIDANKDYYSDDVFDAISLQHIQSVQTGRDTQSKDKP